MYEPIFDDGYGSDFSDADLLDWAIGSSGFNPTMDALTNEFDAWLVKEEFGYSEDEDYQEKDCWEGW